MDGVTLHSFFRAEYDNNMYVYLNVFKEFALGLQHLHDTCEIRHRDIKADNVMVFHDKSKSEVQVFFYFHDICNYGSLAHFHDAGGYP